MFNKRFRFQNITNTTTDLIGTTERSGTSQTTSMIKGKLTISSTTVYELQHQCQYTLATHGFGIAAGFGTELFTRVIIQKLV